MSHFTVLVTKTNEKDIEKQLSPFDENREMPRHISKTRADFIEQGRKDVERAKARVAEYDADPAAYEASTTNENHLKWLKGEARETAKITDEEELFKLGATWHLDDEEEPLDKDGNYWTTTNDDAKWDWYQVGGRWAGYFVPKKGADYQTSDGNLQTRIRVAAGVEEAPQGADVIKVKDIDWDAMDEVERKRRGEYWDEQMKQENPDRRFVWDDNREEVMKMSREEYVGKPVSHATFAVLHDGKWYEKGEMGWFAMVSNAKAEEQWDTEWRKLVESLDPETVVTVVDCHI